MTYNNELIPTDLIETKIYLIRNQKVMLDRDLAQLYGIDTKNLKRAVNRNIDRFPDDFLIKLTKKEFENWRCNFVTSNSDKKGLRYSPYAFTENGVAMLSSILNSKRAIKVNIQIMRTFTRIRKMLLDNDDLRHKIDDLERSYSIKFNTIDKQVKVIFEALNHVLYPQEKDRKKFGFIKE